MIILSSMKPLKHTKIDLVVIKIRIILLSYNNPFSMIMNYSSSINLFMILLRRFISFSFLEGTMTSSFSSNEIASCFSFNTSVTLLFNNKLSLFTHRFRTRFIVFLYLTFKPCFFACISYSVFSVVKASSNQSNFYLFS